MHAASNLTPSGPACLSVGGTKRSGSRFPLSNALPDSVLETLPETARFPSARRTASSFATAPTTNPPLTRAADPNPWNGSNDSSLQDTNATAFQLATASTPPDLLHGCPRRSVGTVAAGVPVFQLNRRTREPSRRRKCRVAAWCQTFPDGARSGNEPLPGLQR